MSPGVKLRSSISFICRLLALWLVVHAVPPVHAQDGASSLPPPSAAGRRFPPLQPRAADRRQLAREPQARDDERAPSYEPPELPEEPQPRPHSALLISGIVTLAMSYVATAVLMGLDLMLASSDLDPGETCSECAAIRLAFIPVAGPWIAMTQKRYLSSGDSTMFALLGASQLLGVVLTIGGAFVFANSERRWIASEQHDRFMFAAMPTRDGAQLALRWTL